MLGIQAKELSLCFIRAGNFVSHRARVLQVPFGKLQLTFTEEWLWSGHSMIHTWLLECCRNGWGVRAKTGCHCWPKTKEDSAGKVS